MKMSKERDSKKRGFLLLSNWRMIDIVSEGEAYSGLWKVVYSSFELHNLRCWLICLSV